MLADGDARRRGTGSFQYIHEHKKIIKEMFLWCHSMVMTKLQDKEELSFTQFLVKYAGMY